MSDAAEWRKYICRVCGLIYDEELGDPDSGLAPGTRFEDIPDDWYCPVCGVTKEDFDPYVLPVAKASSDKQIVRTGEPGVVIVGAGIAGWSVAEAVRSLDDQLPITIVTGCAGDTYHKPELSVALSRGMSPERLRRETGDQAAARLGVRLMSKTQAVGLSPALQQLRTTRGTVQYSNLVLAFGARPALPAALPEKLCWRVNDLEGWSGLYAKLQQGPKRVAIVGAGMVGCELAEDIAKAGHEVILIDRGAQPLSELLPPVAASRMQAGLMREGIRFVGSTLVARIADMGAAKQIHLTQGDPIEVDLVISATGLAVRTRLLEAAGIAFDRGISVDPSTLRTSATHVYALGDCISLNGRPCRFVEPIAHHAKLISAQVTGVDQDLPGYGAANVTIRLKNKCIGLMIRGLPHPDGEWRLLHDNDSGLEMEQWHQGQPVSRLSAV